MGVVTAVNSSVELAAPRVAVIRGEALNPYEMQAYAQVASTVDLFAVGRLKPTYDLGGLELRRILLPALNQLPKSHRLARTSMWRRLGLAHPDYLVGLRRATRDRNILHAAEIAFPLTRQCLDVAAKTRARTILTCWENVPFRNDQDPLTRHVKSRAVREADRFLAASPLAKDALVEEGVDPALVEVIPPGIDCRRFTPEGARSPLRETLNLDDDALLVLFAGRVIGEKGVVELVRALATLRASHLHLVVIGNGDQIDRVRHAADALGIADYVHMIPHLPYAEIPATLRAADLIAVPSLSTPYWQEQFGMILAESMACGVPILTTSSGSIPDVVGDAALVVPEYDVRQLAGGLRALATDPLLRRKYSALGRERALERYDANLIARRLGDCYRRVIASPPRTCWMHGSSS
jgi:glycosyltransferase involved in cell wall biosynthesis